MKIAFFCPTVSGQGGVESAIKNLMAGFDALGDTTHLFLYGGTLDKGWLKDIPFTQYGSPEHSRLSRLTRYAVEPIRAIASWHPDAVICSDVTTLRMAVHGRRFTRRKNLPIASWVHFPLSRVRMKKYLREADLHLAISGFISDDLKAYLPAQKGRVFTIFNAVDLDSAQLVPRPHIPTFLYMGRLTWDDQKRVNDLLLAASRLNGVWKLKIIGAAPELRREDGVRLESYAVKLGINQNVEWLGWQKNPWTAAREATTLVMTSTYEGFPMVLIEGLARGMVCVSSNCKGGPSEIIQPDRNGWLYEVANVDQLTARLQWIVDHPDQLPAQEAVRKTAFPYSAATIAQHAKNAILEVSESRCQIWTEKE